MKRFLMLGLLGLGLVLVSPQQASADPVSITMCQNITTPGSYILTKNLTSFGHCLKVKTDNVKIDLGGYTITGPDGTNAGTVYGITDEGMPRDNVEVTNGALTNWRRAVDLLECRGCKISWLRVTNCGDGIEVGTTPGRDAAIVKHNIVTDTEDDGIRVGRESIVTDNISNGHGTDGIVVFKQSLLQNNVADENGGIGIEVRCESLLIGNVARGNMVMNIMTDVAGCVKVSNLE